MKHGVLVACALVLLTGCGHERAGSGRASLWVTRDRGATVLLVRTVPAGLTAMDALDREADLSTRYGGRFVQSIQGIEGDISQRRDWFWFLNGIEADRSAADYRLHPGDVEWWDFRSWRGQMREPVVVGAFPEPFLHGFDGKTRPAAVRFAPGLARGARAIARLLHATSVAPLTAPAPSDANVFYTVRGTQRFAASQRDASSDAGSPVQFTFAGDAAALARRPDRFRYRYRVP
ncbi:MAG: DUF4430 domain-containing protein [Actinobacteria bacterium]|nr:MAG: DUF4430 domain-containing protein [Actinomycetota bacterium]